MRQWVRCLGPAVGRERGNREKREHEGVCYWGEGTCLLRCEDLFQVATFFAEELLLVHGLQRLLLLLPGLEHLLPPVLQASQSFLDLGTGMREPVLRGGGSQGCEGSRS